MIVLLLALTSAIVCKGQTYNLQQLLAKNEVTVEGGKAVSFDGRSGAISLQAKEDGCIVWLNEVVFSEGTIEVDIKGKDAMGQNFVGIAFHGIDGETNDVVYFRPFNFKAAEQIRRSHSVQYVSHPQHDWKTLRDAFPGKYESEITSPPDPNEWFHARIEVKGDQIIVYINDASAPSLQVTKLNSRKEGKVGVWAGYLTSADFAKLTIRKE